MLPHLRPLRTATQISWPCGEMASRLTTTQRESGDCRFDPCLGHFFSLFVKFLLLWSVRNFIFRGGSRQSLINHRLCSLHSIRLCFHICRYPHLRNRFVAMPGSFDRVNILQEAALREIFSRGAPILGNAYTPQIV